MLYIIGLLIGILILIGGIYYLMKEKNDPESRKIYSIVIIVGLVITIFSMFQLF